MHELRGGIGIAAQGKVWLEKGCGQKQQKEEARKESRR